MYLEKVFSFLERRGNQAPVRGSAAHPKSTNKTDNPSNKITTTAPLLPANVDVTFYKVRTTLYATTRPNGLRHAVLTSVALSQQPVEKLGRELPHVVRLHLDDGPDQPVRQVVQPARYFRPFPVRLVRHAPVGRHFFAGTVCHATRTPAANDRRTIIAWHPLLDRRRRTSCVLCVVHVTITTRTAVDSTRCRFRYRYPNANVELFVWPRSVRKSQDSVE